MTKILFFLVALLPVLAGAQTKPVAYRSHSGNMHYFRLSTDPDNLGWVGPDPVYINPVLTAWDTLPPPLAADTLTNYPYCNNPEVSKDTLEKHYPFYTAAMQDTVKKPTEDTLAKPKERMISRSEVQKNTNIPFGNSGGGTGFQPGYGLLLVFGLSMLILGAFIWVTNRNKVQASR